MDEGNLTTLNQDLSTVYETIFLFLQNQQFFKSSEVFKTECQSYGVQIPNISGKVFFSTKETLGSLGQSISEGFVDKRVVLETFIQKEKNIEDHHLKSGTGNPNSLRNKFKQLQIEYKQLLAITSELTNALQLNIMGQARNMNHVLDHCKIIYPSLFIADVDHIETDQKEFSENDHEGDTDVLKNLDENYHKKNVKKDNEIPSLNIENGRPGSSHNKDIQKNISLPSTPLTEREIRDILETVLKRVIHILDDDMKNKSDYTDQEAVASDHKTEISRLLESVLINVLESPRNYSSGRCSFSTTPCNSKLIQEPVDRNGSGNSELKCHQCMEGETPNVDNKSVNLQRCPSNVETDTNFKEDNLQYHDKKRLSEHYSSSKDGTTPKQPEKATDLETNNLHSKDMHMDVPIIDDTSKLDKDKNNHERYCPNHVETRHTTNESNPAKVTSKTFVPKHYNFPKTPFCYMEHCRLLTNDDKSCKCTTCNPAQNKYYCGCYDVICNELATDINEVSKEQASIRAKFFKFRQNKHNFGLPTILDRYLGGNRCQLCNDVCKCAFESRPKIQRSPPE